MEKSPIIKNIAELKENLRHYLETKISYFEITAFEKVVKVITVITGTYFILMVMGIAILFISGAVALYIGNLLQSIELGLLIVGGFYFLLGVIFILFRNQIFSPVIIKILLDIFFKDDDNDNSK